MGGANGVDAPKGDGDREGDEKPVEAAKGDKIDVTFLGLFRFATWWEIMFCFLALLFAGASAACMPMIIITFGEFTTLLIERAYSRGVVSPTKMLHFFGGAETMYVRC